jgi:DNA-3-methyladenine glycosylase I
MKRCPWAEGAPELSLYHDTEWGVPVHDDRKHFEFLVLESAQAGLSWLTVLRKREGYRVAFADFDPEQVARYGEAEVERLLGDASIIRNQKKIRATIGNAKAFLAIQKEFGSFDKYLWGFVGDEPVVNAWRAQEELPAVTPLSETLSKEMKRRGFSFLGPTVLYSHLQAVGLINDHLVECFRHKEVQQS